MASPVAPRAVCRTLRRRIWLASGATRRHASTVTEVEQVKYDRFLPEVGQPESQHQRDRKRTVESARPFSDFLTDTLNRQHDYLRISVTERCNLRCLYCMPEEGIQLSPNQDLLTTAEIAYLSALFVNQGVNKIRLTGGEPTVRKDIVPLMRQIGALRRNGLRELALTTNGLSLHRKLDDMVAAGLTGVNISLDTLDPFQFQLLTRREGFSAVMKSINRVQEMNKLGAHIKLKINCVVMRGLNDHQILPFVEKTRDEDIEVRFIEYMPFGGNKWSKKKMLPYSEMLDMIRAKYPTLERMQDAKNDTSKTWHIPGFTGRIGFITSMTHNFCGTCNRLRITSDGNLKVCLHGNAEVSLRDLLRQDNDGKPMDEEAFEAVRKLELDRRRQPQLNFDGEEGWMSKEAQLLETIGAAVKRKQARHAGMGELENMKNRPMILIAEQQDAAVRRGLRPPQALQPRLLPKAPWSRVPMHILATTSALSSQARRYSSASRDENDSSGRRTSTLASALGFQSLSGLFQQPTRNRYSSPRTPAEKLEAQSPQETEGEADQSWRRVQGNFFQPADAVWRRESPFKDQVQTSSPAKIVSADSAKSVVRKVRRGSDESSFEQARETQENVPPDLVRRYHARIPYQLRVSLARKEAARASSPRLGGNSRKLNNKNAWGLPNQDEGNSDSAVHSSRPSSSSSTKQQSYPATNASANSSLSYKPLQAAVATKQARRLTHVTPVGQARMVDVGDKPSSKRVAIAWTCVHFANPEPFRLILENNNKKGDVLGLARVAGIMAAKRTSDLIPLCHPLSITKVEVDATLEPAQLKSRLWGNNNFGLVTLQAQVECFGPTGVEMEALTAVTGAALTVFDMCKAVDRGMRIENTRLMYKSGGRSGVYLNPYWEAGLDKTFFEDRGLERSSPSGVKPEQQIACPPAVA